MVTALQFFVPAVAPLPTLAITTAPVVSFEAILADVEPIEVAADQLQLDTLGGPAANDVSTLEQVSVTDQAVDQPPVEETVDSRPAPETMVAAQIIAAAAQLASSPDKLTAAREMPQQNRIAVAPDKTDAPVRATSVTGAPVIAKLQNDPDPAKTTATEIEPASQNISSQPSSHRPPVEPTSLTVPTTTASAITQPQIFHELDLARDLAWIGNLAQEIVVASDDRHHLSFRLMPRSLGQLDIDLSRSPDGLRVEMTATTERAAQIIAAEQPRLIDELRQSGMKTAGADLATGQHSGSQRGHPPARADLPFFNAQTRPAKTTNRPDGRFA